MALPFGALTDTIFSIPVKQSKDGVMQPLQGGPQFSGVVSASGATPLTLNRIVGMVSFTGVGSIATGGNTTVVINNSLVTANTKGLIAFQGGTFAAGSNPVINTITYGAGTISINVINTDDTTATGAAGVLNFSYHLFQL